MVDIAGLPAVPTVDDFTFRIGNDNDPATWAAAPAPSNIIVRSSAGGSGSDRLTILRPDGAIANTWLQVIVKATATTGLATPDVFYFGNAIGESGDSAANALVNASDEV